MQIIRKIDSIIRLNGGNRIKAEFDLALKKKKKT